MSNDQTTPPDHAGKRSLGLDADVWYLADFLSADEAAALYREVLPRLDIDNPTVLMADGTRVPVQTPTYIFAEPELTGLDAFSEHSGERSAWTPLLAGVRDRIATATGVRFPAARVVYYRDGNEGIDFHFDPPAYGPTDEIASLSLGAEREFQLRRNDDHDDITRLRLAPGSLLFMGRGCQDLYEHAVPLEPASTAPRINLTFRKHKLHTPIQGE